MKYTTSFIAVFVLFLAFTNARQFITIDSFATPQTPLVLIISGTEGTADDYDWWAPFPTDINYAGPPAANFHNTNDCISGQRDVVLGYEGATPSGSVAVISLVNQRASVALPLNYAGGAYFQWDGADGTSGSPFPGALLQTTPGIGSGISTSLPESDGRFVDFTSSGRAFGIGMNISSDLDVNYFLDAVDDNNVLNELAFVHIPPGGSNEIRYFFRFDDSRWNNLATFNWARVGAFQVRIFTFIGDDQQAVDTDFFNIGVLGYEVLGNVFRDCTCDGTPESFVQGVVMNLYSGSTGTGTVLQTATTDVSGDFAFYPQNDGTFTVCLADRTLERCSSISSACRTFTLSNRVDPTPLTFPLTTVASLQAPPAQTIECGSCITVPDCLPAATATTCAGSTEPVTTFTDGPTTGGCTKSFVRTFRDGSGNTATQTITIVDTTAPTLVTPASPVTRACDATGTQTFSQWVTARAGATWTDCTTLSFSNNAGTQNPGNCGSVTVTFIATDQCALQTPTTATYTVTDGVAPTFTTAPQSVSQQCNQNGSDITAYNSWVSSRGNGGTATDNCTAQSAIVYTNNSSGTPTRGCNNPTSVTFSATDSCGNTGSAIATFTITDSTGPSFTTQATSPTVQCSSTSTDAFNTWLAANGNSVATDTCTSAANLVFTNDFVGSAPTGCNDAETVTFTVADDCAQTSRTTGTFTVRDTTNPTLTQQASPLVVDCSAGGSTALDSWLADNGGARATDTCSSVTWTNSFNPLSGDCAQTPVTFTGCDSCNLCVRSTTTYSINDSTAPTFVTAPQDQSVSCGTTLQTTYDAWVASSGGATVSDNCASPNELTITNNAPADFPTSSACNSAVTVNYRVVDPCGNQSPVSTARFSVTDNIPPTFTSFVIDQTVECNSSAAASYTSWRSSRGGAAAVDTCSSVSYSNNGPASVTIPSGQCSNTAAVTFTATDSCGNTAQTSGSFTVQDTVPPTITTQAADASSQCDTTGVTAWLNNNGGARATDACSTVTWINNFAGFNGGCTETARVTFTALDSCGLARDTTATYSINDTNPPVISPQASARTVPCDSNTGTALTTWLNDNGGARATDACQDDADLTWSNNFSSAPVGCDFVSVTFTVTDACGNSATTSSRFTATDNTAPTFSPPASDLTVECDGAGNTNDFATFVSTRGGAVAVDACALSFTWTNDAPATGPVGCGTRTVRFTVEDECGNSAVTSATYRVVDTQMPSFTTLPSNSQAECDGNGNTADINAWANSNAGAVANDVCTSPVTWTRAQTSTSGDACSSGSVYTFTARDACGNSASATATFTIHDFTAPAITTEPADATYECDGNGNTNQVTSWINNNAGARASDVCQGAVTWANDFSDTLLSCSSELVTFVASDACGNSVSRSATVAIEDTTDPIFSFFPEDVTLPCDADASTDATGFAEASDVCSGNLLVTMNETEFDEPPVGDCPGDHIITRTFFSVDNCGNAITRDQVVTVVIQRSSGPCDPEGCECDDCCPPAAASDCLPVNCQAVACRSTPCEASMCTCDDKKSVTKVQREVEFEIPQCKPVYIYVNDDDDTPHDVDTAEVAKQRMFVTNEPIHEKFLN